jgi:hypothetical protein
MPGIGGACGHVGSCRRRDIVTRSGQRGNGFAQVPFKRPLDKETAPALAAAAPARRESERRGRHNSGKDLPEPGDGARSLSEVSAPPPKRVRAPRAPASPGLFLSAVPRPALQDEWDAWIDASIFSLVL